MDFLLQLFFLVLFLVLFNVFSYKYVSSYWRIPFSLLASAAIFLWGATFLDLSLRQMGMTNLLEGLLWGLGFSTLLLVFMAIASRFKIAKGLFSDDRSKLKLSNLIYKTTVDIPFGTVLFEEVIFRGVLLGYLLVNVSEISAILITSALFGLWHILPSIDFGNTNLIAKRKSLITNVLGTVIFTSIVGVFFAWIRIESGSILAPIVVHIAANSGGLVGTWLLARFSKS